MVDMEMKNQTEIEEFILLGFEDLQNLQIPIFLIFLLIYILTMAGNLLVVVLIVTDQHLHSPMYFFLGNLSCLEVCYSSTILPRMLASFLSSDKVVFKSICLLQSFFFGGLAGTECYLLSIMSYDRFLAICKPLHYVIHMNGKLCRHLAYVSWLNGFIASSMLVLLMSQLIFCGPNVINHFFCDIVQILRLSCSDIQLVSMLLLLFSAAFTLPPFVLTVTSYFCIISKILRISSATGRQKTFSTCSSHLIVVTIFYGSLMTVYMLPETSELIELNKSFSVSYTILTPLVNPLIYSLRNQEVKEALRRVICKYFTRH
ncbi:olfactory receptor 5B21-like [Varanus komodoensis]|uniref:olfactory receptor 5B21-like n=1 Tax=Varanus komodoensis TaxID=61221 RepID=UPI001CF76A82|nr:olfactory receptor 5B21-like [Varanus komodoensis]